MSGTAPSKKWLSRHPALHTLSWSPFKTIASNRSYVDFALSDFVHGHVDGADISTVGFDMTHPILDAQRQSTKSLLLVLTPVVVVTTYSAAEAATRATTSSRETAAAGKEG